MSRKRRKKRSTGRKIVITLLIILLIIFGALLFLLQRFYSKSNYIDDQKAIEAAAQAYEQLDETTKTEIESTGLSEEEQTELQAQMESILAKVEEAKESKESQKMSIPTTDDIYTVLVVMENNESQTLDMGVFAIFSLNRTKNQMNVITLAEDLAVNVEGYGIRKLLAAYRIGGGPLLASTVQSNYGVRIDNYACVDVEGINQEAEKFQGMEITVSNVNEIVNELMSYVTHNVPTTKVVSLISEIPGLVNSNIESRELEIPIAGLYSEQGELQVPNQPETNEQIQNLLYGTEG